jgi:glycine/D-amino acid oxidase-like deaminating enzyme
MSTRPDRPDGGGAADAAGERAENGLAAAWWHARAAAPPPRPALTGEIACDVAIVGAGIAGLSCALHLAAANVRVAVLEAGVVGCGASGRNTGFVVPALNASLGPQELVARLGRERGARLAALAAQSGDFLFALVARHAIDCAAVRAGFLQAAPWRRQLAGLAARARDWAGVGGDVAVLDAAAVAARTGARGYAGALAFHSGGTIDPLAYTRGLAAAAAAAGAQVFERSPVRGLARGDGWRVATDRGAVRARRVVLATNAFAAPLVPDLARALIPVVVHQIATAPLDPARRAAVLPAGGCVTDMRRDAIAFRLSPEGRLIGGGIAALAWNADRRLPARFVARFEKLLPGAGPLAATHVWSGTIALTRGFLPRLYEPAPGCLALVACNGRGNALATMLGAELGRALAADDLDAFVLPAEPPTPVPLHALARLGPRLWLPWARLRDGVDGLRKS